MAFREVVAGNFKNSELVFVDLKTKEAGTVLATGIYDGIKEFGKEGEKSPCYLIRQEDDTTVALNDWGQLKSLIASAELAIGTMVRVTYGGMKTVPSGPSAGRKAHQFKLETDDEA